MARYVMQTAVTVPAGANPYLQPARVLKKGDVVELTSAEQTAITGAGGTLRVTSTTAATSTRDQLAEAFAASNATP